MMGLSGENEREIEGEGGLLLFYKKVKLTLHRFNTYRFCLFVLFFLIQI